MEWTANGVGLEMEWISNHLYTIRTGWGVDFRTKTEVASKLVNHFLNYDSKPDLTLFHMGYNPPLEMRRHPSFTTWRMI